MAWITGTSTNFKDLLADVVTAAVANGWTANRQVTTNPSPRTHEVMLQGPGFGVGFEVYAGIRTYQDSLNNHYCWEVRGFTTYSAAQTWDNQTGASPQPVMRLWDSTIDYWLSITDRRIVLIAKCSNTYHSLYLGFVNAFANPVEYPYPMYVASDSATFGPFGATDNDTRAIAMPGDGSAYIREIGGLWRNVVVHDESALYDYQTVSESRYTMWPYLSPCRNNLPNSPYYPPLTRIEPLPGVSDSLFMMNTYIVGCDDKLGVLGVLEGIYWIPGNTISAEQLLTNGGNNYRTFIAISRSTESPSQFYAVEEV